MTMINTNTTNYDHQNSIAIKQNDKFFTKIMSKETSIANASTRIYYGGASSSIPFLWESQPGTPKDALLSTRTSLPPLTPPPSYQTNIIISPHKNKNFKTTLFATIFPRQLLGSKKPSTRMSPSSSMSSSTSSSSSSSNWSSSSTFRRRRSFPFVKSPVRGCRVEYEDEGEDHLGPPSPTSTLCCGVNKCRSLSGYKSKGRMKIGFLSLLGRHG